MAKIDDCVRQELKSIDFSLKILNFPPKMEF